MRIAMVGSRGIPTNYSGIEVSLQEICPRLVERGHAVLVYCAADAAPGKSTYAHVRLRKLPAIYTKHLETATRSLLSTFEEVFRSNDIVHFHALGPSLLSLLPRLTGKGTVATIHGLDWQREKWGRGARAVLKLGEWGSVHFPDATVVVSESLKEYFRRRYGREVVYIPNGVTVRQPQERKLLASLGLQSMPYILYVSRLIPGKGLDCLLKAFSRVKTEHKLVLAGDAGYDRGYEMRLKRLATRNVVFTGFVTGRLLEELFSNAEFYVHPAPMEGFSISLLEAMSYGRCVLASDIRPNKEAVSDKGFYFRCGDVEDLGRAIEWLVSHEDLAKAKGEEAREHARQNYSWERIVDRIEALYVDVLRRKKKKSLCTVPRSQPVEAVEYPDEGREGEPL